MEKAILYVKESYNELINKVTWPSIANLQGTTITVIVASIIFAIVVAIMNAISKGITDLIYPG